jgi:hypothetical protein
MKSFALTDRAAFSVQASFIGGESLLQLDECQGDGYEVRAAIGTSFALLGREGFVNAQAGRRSRGDCERNLLGSQPGSSLRPSGT